MALEAAFEIAAKASDWLAGEATPNFLGVAVLVEDGLCGLSVPQLAEVGCLHGFIDEQLSSPSLTAYVLIASFGVALAFGGSKMLAPWAIGYAEVSDTRPPPRTASVSGAHAANGSSGMTAWGKRVSHMAPSLFPAWELLRKDATPGWYADR